MFDLIQEAKNNKHGLVFEKYQMPEITWEDIVKHIYNESILNNPALREKVEKKQKKT